MVTQMSNEYMFDYDLDTNMVYMCDEPIGKLDKPHVLAILKKGETCFGRFSPELNKAVHYFTVDSAVCPTCRGDFYAITKVNDVSLGHCKECRVPLYEFDGKVHITYNGRTGAKTWHNLLTE